MSISNFTCTKSNFTPLGPRGERLSKEEGEDAPPPDGKGEANLGLSGQVEHTNGDPKTIEPRVADCQSRPG
jgi:hypothetical protein